LLEDGWVVVLTHLVVARAFLGACCDTAQSLTIILYLMLLGSAIMCIGAIVRHWIFAWGVC
jgi:hypothetical protein